MTFDLLISGGTVVDGSGNQSRTCDVAVKDGIIAAIGTDLGTAHRTIDAGGALVTPGFVDIHSHYDGQAVWDSRLLPSSWHGVTTTVFGNCGVGFAPVRRHDHETLIALMEGVEDIPGTALHEGLTWAWETFPEYLDAVDRRYDMDIAAQVPHAAVRLYVMGQRGADGEPATDAEIGEMGRIVAEAVRAGAVGFTTSRTVNHRTSSGGETPTLHAEHSELLGIARALGEVGVGVIELITDFDDFASETDLIRRLARESGRPVSFSLQPRPSRPELPAALLDFLTATNADSLCVRGQVAPRPVGVLFGHSATINPFSSSALMKELEKLPLDRRLEELRRPEIRSRIIDEASDRPRGALRTTRHSLGRAKRRILGRVDHSTRFDGMYVLTDPPNYEPDPATNVALEGSSRRHDVDGFVYDLLLEDEGRRLLYAPIFNYTDNNLDEAGRLIAHEHSVMGLGDGGAHVGIIADASFPTTMLAHWGRDRTRGAMFDVPFLVRQLTHQTARAIGLDDRGLLKEGMRADINVIDFERLSARAPYIARDLPSDGARFLQRADGYVHTFVHGTETYAEGVPTGELPGRLIRNRA